MEYIRIAHYAERFGSIPLAISFSAPLVAFLDLKGLLEDLVVLLCEWLVTVEGMLPLPSPPALNLKGIEARVR